MDPLTVALACLVVAEPFLVLFAAPRITRRLTETNARRIFRELAGLEDGHTLADLLAVRLADMMAEVRGLLTPLAVQDPAAARAELAEAIGQAVAAQAAAIIPGAVEAAVGAAVTGRMGALSAGGVEARQSKAAMEWTLKQKATEKFGFKALLALAALKATDARLYTVAVETAGLAPDKMEEFLTENAAKLGLGGGAAAKPKDSLMRV